MINAQILRNAIAHNIQNRVGFDVNVFVTDVENGFNVRIVVLSVDPEECQRYNSGIINLIGLFTSNLVTGTDNYDAPEYTCTITPSRAEVFVANYGN